MELKAVLLAKYPRISQACAVAVILISLTALIGWFTGSSTLKGIRAGYIPMAPNTAFVFLLLAASLTITSAKSLRFRNIARITIGLVAVLIISRMSEYLASVELRVDQWLFNFPSESIGLAPVGKMAFFTSFTFLLLGSSLFLFTWREPRWLHSIGHGLSAVVTFIGLAFCLGYLYGAPLMYGGRSIPMALNTAICFLLAGTALVIKGSLRNVEERVVARAEIGRAHV